MTIDLIYVITLCDELERDIELPAIVFEDNAPTIQLTDGLSAKAKKSKHFLMLINFVKEQVLFGLIEIQKIPSKDNVADMLTKALDWKEFETKASRILGLDSLEESKLEGLPIKYHLFTFIYRVCAYRSNR